MIFKPYVTQGMTVMDVGCGMGFNAIGLAKLIGDEGCVIAVDLQHQMLDVLRKRAEQAGVAHRIRTHLCASDSIGIEVTVDFAVAFWVVHEVPDAGGFLRQVRSCLSSDGRFLVAEPRFHISAKTFRAMLATARDAGLKLSDEPRIRASRAALFLRQ